VLISFSCSEDLTAPEPYAPDETATAKALRDCVYDTAPDYTGDQTCTDVSNPINVGRLDCRAQTPSGQARAGYREFNNYGVYTIYGGFTSDTRRAVRVERRFKNFKRGASKTALFKTTFKISDISASHTYIAQTHASKNVVVGPCKGKKHTSAFWLLRAEPKPGNANKIDLYREESVRPYVQGGTGDCARGSRTKTYLMTIDRNKDYSLEVKTGYNSSQRSFAEIIIDGRKFRKNQTFTTEEMYFRFGAYRAHASGSNSNRKAVVRFKNTEYCHPNY